MILKFKREFSSNLCLMLKMSFLSSVRRFASFIPKPSSLQNQIQTIRREFEYLGEGTVELQRDDITGVATIKLRNPERKNSLSGKMMSQLSQVIHELQQWPQGKAVIISGENHFFCSGGDLNTVRRIADPENGRKMSLLMHDNCTRLQSLPLLSVALIEGMALGGGAEIATSCDFRLFTPSAQMGFVHIRIGIVSAWGGGSRLSQLIGPQRALDLMLTGRIVDSEEAKQIGLCEQILDSKEDSLIQTMNWLKKYTKRPKETLRAVKGIVNGQRYLPLELALHEEVDHSVSVWGDTNHLLGLSLKVKHN